MKAKAIQVDAATLQAIYDSVIHWEEDICKPLRSGRVISRDIISTLCHTGCEAE